ncbi:MAG: tetratricopeptide repeat protein [Polyangiaceae bacterium]
MHRSWAPLAVAVLLGLGSVACGGKQKDSNLPTGTRVDTPSTGGPGAVYSPGGQQYAVTDAPSSGEAATNRPRMNAQAQASYQAGMSAFQAGDLQGARQQFTQATESDPKAYQAFYSLGVVKERLGEVSGAMSSYQKAVSVVPDYEPAIVGYAVLAARSGKGGEAESFLNSKAAKMPKSAAVPAAMAEVKSIQGDSAEAQKYAREALKKNPDYRPAMIVIARDHYRRRRLDLALYTLQAVLDGFGDENPARDKDNAEARLLRALIYKEQGNRKGAMEDFEAAMKTRPDLVEAQVHLASYHLEAGNATTAAQLLETALKYDKNNVLARLNLGDAYRLLGKTTEAKKELEWVVSKDPQLAEVHYNLGLLYLFSASVPGVSEGQAVDKAISEFETFKKMKPRAKPGEKDDTDELITRAKTKKAIIDSKAAEKPKPAASSGATSGGSTGSMPDSGAKK